MDAADSAADAAVHDVDDAGLGAADGSDSGPADCVWSWIAHGRLDGGDHYQCIDMQAFDYCDRWAASMTVGSTLVAFASCDVSLGCVSADWCDATGCYCGGGPPCADGMICAEDLGRGNVRCVQCAVGADP